MPHVIVKFWPGKSEQQKPRLVAMEEVKSQGWIALQEIRIRRK
jgi:hypothetical protein